MPKKNVDIGEICSKRETEREMIDVPARWHQHSFGQRPIQRSPAPCGPRAGFAVGFSSKTSEVFAWTQGFIHVNMMILACSLFEPYEAASAVQGRKTIHLNIVIEKIAIPVANPSFAKQQRVSKSPMEREDYHLVTAIYPKKK